MGNAEPGAKRGCTLQTCDDADIQSELVTDHVLLGQVRKVQLKSRS